MNMCTITHTIKTHTLNTQRLLIENLAICHAEELFTPLSDMRLYALVSPNPPQSLEILKERFAYIGKGKSPDGTSIWLNWVVRCKQTHVAVGQLEADVKDGIATIGYYTFVEHQKKGIAKEAVAKIMEVIASGYSVHTFVLEMDTRNRASARIAEGLGFKWISTIDNVCEIDGLQSHEFRFEYSLKENLEKT